MADPSTDYPLLSPQDVQAPATAAGAPDQADLATQWSNFLADDKNRSALMQFGVALMQPISPGQTLAGHVGQAVGSAGEAVGRLTEEERKAQEAASKDEARTIRSQAALETATVRSQSAADLANYRTSEQARKAAHDADNIANQIRLLDEKIRHNQATEGLMKDRMSLSERLNAINNGTKTFIAQQRLDAETAKDYTTYEARMKKLQSDAAFLGQPTSDLQILPPDQFMLRREGLRRMPQEAPAPASGPQAQPSPGPTLPSPQGPRPSPFQPTIQQPQAPGPQATPKGNYGGTPTPEAVDFLRRNPNTMEQFDAKFGAGTAARLLGILAQ